MLPESPALLSGFQAFATPGTLPPSVTAPHLRPLPSAGVTPLPRYYGPLRHPDGPACPSRGPGWMCAASPPGLPVLLPSSPSMRASVTTPGSGSVPASLSSPSANGLPLKPGGSASVLSVSRPARRSLAFRPAWSLSRPWRPLTPECFRTIRLIRPGCYQPERQLLGGKIRIIRTRQKKAPFHGALALRG